MRGCIWTALRFWPLRTRLCSASNPSLCAHTPSSSKSQTLEMVNQAAPGRRPMCPSCSKPLRLCLCVRIKTPRLRNSVAITILQHSLEKKHALNTARIAKLGLWNVTVATVSDVNFEAQIVIRQLRAGSDLGNCINSSESLEFGYSGENPEEVVSGKGELGSLEIEERFGNPEDKNDEIGVANGGFRVENDFDGVGSCQMSGGEENKDDLHEGGPLQVNEDPALTFTFTKYGGVTSFAHRMGTKIQLQNPDFEHFLASKEAVGALTKNGFSVKKSQKKLINGKNEVEEGEEFEIAIPPGSLLLFPSQRSIGIEDIDFDVKHLIILDGTWRKAKRMYIENPWLKLLPHLKLNLNKMSLYGEVRRQPKAGYLSTIESIVYALKAVGDNDAEGLDDLLDVFESMVVDQRRFKDESLSKISQEERT